ncbi:ATP-dependent zinc metalloprotease YME1L [Eupeodes corollae]|uniref:ATP-dependent zinc metalloprotease YME1L n=1 Tax=Eupeodes corollae TaxID=290404 RepID=UPI00248F75A0|nr:ATP-dependent zinc metalloprotease YME1L [Eupeodes corollae]
MMLASSHTLPPFYLTSIGRKPHYYSARKSSSSFSQKNIRDGKNTVLDELAALLTKSHKSILNIAAHNACIKTFFEKGRLNRVLEDVAVSLKHIDANIIAKHITSSRQNSRHLMSVTVNTGIADVKCLLNRRRGLGSNYEIKFVRHFKTDRAIEAEAKRSPSLIARIRNSLGGSSNKYEPSIAVHTETLTKLLKNSTEGGLQKDGEKNIKVAFAEGYLAALNSDETTKSGKTMKYLKVFQQLLIIVVFLGILVSLFSSSGGSMFRIQLGNQVEVDPEEINVTFDDVKGCDEAKQELKEVVEFLKNPEKFSNLGGKLPKGVLLVGPPGTGKTLLARAVAGEANVPFFHAAGPEFDEVLVGQGARRVRDLFKAAKARAPCVIFIDEIDSVGAKRTNSVLHPYANQTINQLLSEMDGFHQNAGVIVLGATNRRDDLDQALLRPGRFDVEVVVSTPDFTGRKEILSLYLSKILHDEIDIDILARGTSGFTGADLENMINQGALRAAIDGAESVTMKHLESARDKVLMGPERKARLPDEEANLITAYHEGGHAIVAYYTRESHPLHKVTIMPRGPSLGHTAYIPEKERYHVTRAQLLAMMDTMMGGRAAEELIFGIDKITSGASSDLKQATSIATHMVKDWGMSEKVGLRTIETPKGLGQVESLGHHTVEAVDAEIKRILSESYERAKAILKKHAKEHKALAEALLKYETLDAEDIKAIMNGSQ